MEIPIIHLPLDESGLAPTHLKEESYPITEEGYGLLYPSWGPFYTDSVTVLNDNDEELKRDLDWEPFLPYQQASVELGQSVHRGIVIKQPGVQSVVFVRQVVGGQYANSNIAFDDLLKEFKKYRNNILWDEIIKPPKFNPTDHTHHVNDLKGVQGMTEAIIEIAEVLRWYLTDHVLEIDKIIGLTDKLDSLTQAIGNNLSKIEQLNQNVIDLGAEGEEQAQAIENNKQTIASIQQSLSDTIEELSSLTVRVEACEQHNINTDETFDELDTRLADINNNIVTLTENSNTFGYIQKRITGNEQLERRHRTTVYDKVSATSSVHEIVYSQFQLGDTLEFNTPLYGTYTTSFSCPGATFLLPDGTQTTSQELEGNGGVTWRYIGNKLFLIVDIR